MTPEVRVISTDVFDNSKTIKIIIHGLETTSCLNSFLPPYWTIVERKRGIRIHTDPERKRITLPNVGDDFLSSPGNIFILLHEIGHAVSDEGTDEEDLEEECRLRDKIRYEEEGTLTELERLDYQRLVLSSERKAWKYALKTIRKLRKRKIDLEPRLSEEELLRLSEEKLSKYLI